MVGFITSALRSDNSMTLIYMWMFVIVSSAEFVLCHREEHCIVPATLLPWIQVSYLKVIHSNPMPTHNCKQLTPAQLTNLSQYSFVSYCFRKSVLTETNKRKKKLGCQIIIHFPQFSKFQGKTTDSGTILTKSCG